MTINFLKTSSRSTVLAVKSIVFVGDVSLGIQTDRGNATPTRERVRPSVSTHGMGACATATLLFGSKVRISSDRRPEDEKCERR